MTTFTEEREYLLDEIAGQLLTNLKYKFNISLDSNSSNDSVVPGSYGNTIHLYRSNKDLGYPKLQITFEYNIFGLKLALKWHKDDMTDGQLLHEKTILYTSLFDRFERSNVDYIMDYHFDKAIMELSHIYSKAISAIFYFLVDNVNYTEADKKKALQEEYETLSTNIAQFLGTSTTMASMTSRK